MITTPTAVQLARLRWCRLNGHTWPPLREARKGDEHWCDMCGSTRFIEPNGTPRYTREWE